MMLAGELLKFEWCLWYGLNLERNVLVSFLVVIEVKEKDSRTYRICLLVCLQVNLLGRVVDPLESH